MGRNLGDWAGVGRDHKALLLPHGAKSYRRCGVGVQGAGEQEGGSQLSLGQGEGSWEAPQMQHLDWVLYSQGGGIVQAADTP